MKVDVKLTGVDGVLKTLSSLPAEVVSKRGGPVKAALAKGARFLRDRERDNLRAVLEPGDESTGLLEQNIIASDAPPVSFRCLRTCCWPMVRGAGSTPSSLTIH